MHARMCGCYYMASDAWRLPVGGCSTLSEPPNSNSSMRSMHTHTWVPTHGVKPAGQTLSAGAAAEAYKLQKLLPMLVAVRGRVGCANPRACELCDSKAAIYEVIGCAREGEGVSSGRTYGMHSAPPRLVPVLKTSSPPSPR